MKTTKKPKKENLIKKYANFDESNFSLTTHNLICLPKCPVYILERLITNKLRQAFIIGYGKAIALNKVKNKTRKLKNIDKIKLYNEKVFVSLIGPIYENEIDKYNKRKK